MGTLFLRYMELVYGVCLKYLGQPESAQDAVMDIYEHVNRKLPDHEVENFSAWLYMVSKNHCLQLLRKKKNLLTISLDDPVMQNGREMHQEDDEFDLDVTEDIADQLQDCIRQLPEKQKACLTMRYLQDLDYSEIALSLDCSEQSARANVSQALRRLRAALKECP